MFKLRTLGLSPILAGALLCATALHANTALAGWTNTSSSKPSLLAAGSGSAIYAADLAAIYASNDGGNTWSTAGTPAGSPYTALSYVNNALWLGTDKSGTAYSSNGSSWTQANSGQIIPLINTANKILSITAANSSTLLAGNTSGLYRSSDNGATWSSNASGLPQTGTPPFTVKAPVSALAATSAGAALAGTSDGIYRSSDGGATWSNAALAGVQVSTLLALPGTTTLYAIAGGLYKSSDDGKTWAAVSAWSFGTPTALAAHPTDGLTVYVGDSQGSVRSSADSGGTWTQLGGAAATSGSILALAVPASDATALVAATANGLYLYTATAITQPPFSIPARFSATPGDTVESDEIVVAGLTAPAAISITGGSYSINGGAYTQLAGTVVPGARVKVKLQASASYNTKTSATLTIGKRSANFEVSTLKKTVVTDLTTVLKVTTGVTLSNGELSVANGANMEFQANTPTDVVIKPAGGATFTTKNSLGSSANYTAGTQTNSPTFVTQTITDSSGNASTGLAIANGSADITASNSLTVPFVSTATTTPALTLGSGGSLQVKANSQQSSAGILSGQATINFNGFAAGKINGFAATGSTTVYGGETVSLTTAGALKELRIGSLNGDKSLPGDPLTLGNLDTGVSVPKLDGNLQRLGNTSSLVDLAKAALDAQFGASGSATYNTASGILTYVVNGNTYRFIPVGNPLVQVATAAAINAFTATNAASTASGTFALVNRGVQLTLSSTLGYFTDFDKALKAIDSSASFTLKSTGALKITLGGNTYYTAPSSLATSGSSTTPGFGLDASGRYTFQDSAGGIQTLYQIFADLSTLDQTLKSIDATATASYSGNGTTAVTLANTPYSFKPDYLLTPLPSSHSNDLWWIDGANIFIRYPDNTAQGFSL